MNILFLTMNVMSSLDERGIYTDLLGHMIKEGHHVTVLTPTQRREGKETNKKDFEVYSIIQVKTGNLQKCNVIEKGIAQLLIDTQYKSAIAKFCGSCGFDLILYSTPPITLVGSIRWAKKKYRAKTYLLLKDIFPQNAVDLGMLSKSGVKAPLYRFFRRKEKGLYAISDRIGCMSQANVDYVIKRNPEVEASKVEVCPNSIEVQDTSVTAEERETLRKKYGIPLDKKVFVYGGNLGKPQGVPFIIECLRACQSVDDAFFLIVGSGTDYGLLEGFVKAEKPRNVLLLPSLPKDEYDHILAACDIGLIFLDHRFTIPNFPSRLLSYMQAGLPVLACTDTATDIGKVITEGGFGWWCESNDAATFAKTICTAKESVLEPCREKALSYLHKYYTVEKNAETIFAEK